MVGTCFISGHWGIHQGENSKNGTKPKQPPITPCKFKNSPKNTWEILWMWKFHRGLRNWFNQGSHQKLWNFYSFAVKAHPVAWTETFYCPKCGSSTKELPGFGAVCNQWMSGSHLCFVRKQEGALQTINICLSPKSGYSVYLSSSSASYWHCIDRAVGQL